MTENRSADPVRVVIVDDTADIRHLLRVALEREREFVVVAEAGDGEAGIAAVASHQPDLVLLDVALPELDGLQVLPVIRHQSPQSVVVMLTGLPEDSTALSAIELRAHGFIRKGGTITALLSQIREVLEVQAERRQRRAGDVPA